MNAELLNKYLRNECTPRELDEVLTWLRTDAATASGKKIMQKCWEGVQPGEEQSEADFEGMLDRLHHQINLADGAPQRKRPARILRLLSRAAAILFIPVLALLLWTYGRGELLFLANAGKADWIEIATPPGAKTTFSLPDGSMVWLNHGSKLKYPPRFAAGRREVELEGEAFFEVESDLNRPFRVISGPLDVVATGTEFNVLAYPEDTTLAVTLISGRVAIQQDGRNRSRTLYTMRPDEHLIFQKQARKLIPAEVNTEKYIAWKAGKLIFENDPFDVVVARLSRWFNVDIDLDDPELSNYTYTATFVSETLPQVLELMKLASPIDYQTTPRALQADGSYSKMKVVISRK